MEDETFTGTAPAESDVPAIDQQPQEPTAPKAPKAVKRMKPRTAKTTRGILRQIPGRQHSHRR